MSLEQNIGFLLFLHLVHRMRRGNRFWITYDNHVKWDLEPILIQLQSKVNPFSILSLKFVFGNNQDTWSKIGWVLSPNNTLNHTNCFDYIQNE